jgi:hypothetical protein
MSLSIVSNILAGFLHIFPHITIGLSHIRVRICLSLILLLLALLLLLACFLRKHRCGKK